MASPLAKGLFHRAISQSGGYPVDEFYTLDQAEGLGSKIARHLGLEDTENPLKSIEGMRALGWEAIVQGRWNQNPELTSRLQIDRLGSTETDLALTNSIGQYWVNFATSGSPDGDGLTPWPDYTADTRHYLELGQEIHQGKALEAELCAVFDRIREVKSLAFSVGSE
jgi:carboxylesterase type B